MIFIYSNRSLLAVSFNTKKSAIVDFYDTNKNAVISTKSLNISAKSYQNMGTQKRRLNKYANDLEGLEKSKFFKGNELRWGQKVLNKNQCENKVLEIVLPDSIITDDAVKVLNDFQSEWSKKGIEVIYEIAK